MHNRFQFISSRWERIEEYIIGHLKRPSYDSIYSDEQMVVFFNESDRQSNELVDCVFSRKNNEKLNAANHIQFKPI